MKESTGAMWILQLAIVFILLYVAFIVVVLQYFKTVKTKNECVTIIEKYDGLNSKSVGLVSNYLKSIQYNSMGSCADVSGTVRPGIYGALSLGDNASGYKLEKVTDAKKKYYFCIRKLKKGRANFYQLNLFFKFSLPIIGETSYYTVAGSTGLFESKDDDYYSDVYFGS